jgi:hypothetical protein
MEPIKCSEEMDKFFSKLAEFKKDLKDKADNTYGSDRGGVIESLYEKLHEFFKIEGEE